MNATLLPNRTVRTIFALLAMVAVGVLFRLELSSIPNVKPIAAMALWGAFAFRSVWLPAAALLVVMAVSDLYLGHYAWPIAASVYGSLLISCGLGVWIRRRLDRAGQTGVAAAGPWVIVASLAMSTGFYVLTNFAVWATGWYPATAAGLVDCYIAAIPFYRFTLVGDLAFTLGGLAAWQFVAEAAKALTARPATLS